ncbi:MAG: amidohydrolase family protein [Desulfobacterales bacterium]|nr:amidohydrolase family protein [Desulfobacterales bacterium]
MKKIDFEAHFITPDWFSQMFKNKGYPRYTREKTAGACRVQWAAGIVEPIGDVLLNKLLDLGEERLKAMDAAGVDVQVLSLTIPGVELLDPAVATALARKTNDVLAAAIRKYPDRFSGFAALAPQNPQAAADELERAVKTLGLIGWKTQSNYGDGYLDDPKYRPILERAEQLDVPVYLHPTFPIIAQLKTSYGWALAGAPFGFGLEAALCMMRLVLSGVFDNFPRLRIILGHLGEGLPFLLARIDYPYVIPWFDPKARPSLEKKPSEYFKSNVFVTTSGNYYTPAFMCTHAALGIERILLGTDYPYEEPGECMRFIDGLSISREDKDRIYGLNARQFGIGTN